MAPAAGLTVSEVGESASEGEKWSAAQAAVAGSRWEAERLATGVLVREEEEEREVAEERHEEEAEDHLRC